MNQRSKCAVVFERGKSHLFLLLQISKKVLPDDKKNIQTSNRLMKNLSLSKRCLSGFAVSYPTETRLLTGQPISEPPDSNTIFKLCVTVIAFSIMVKNKFGLIRELWERP